MLAAPAAAHADCPPGSIGASSGGTFQTNNGQIYSPNGQIFVPHGVNVWLPDLDTVAANISTTLPGINFIRVPVAPTNDDPENGTWPSPLQVSSAVQKLNAAGIVVEFENHTTSNGSTRGGGQGQVYTGGMLANEQAFYSSFAGFFRDNPDVWFGTNNEPPATDLAALGAWHRTTYDTIRATGNNNPVMLEVNGWDDPASFGAGYVAQDYASMTNVIGDVHYYGWVTKSTDQATNDAFLAQAIANTQRNIPVANGPLPIIIGEYGNSTDGTEIDDNGDQIIRAVNTSGYGSAAWTYGVGDADSLGRGALFGSGNLNTEGRMIADYIKAGGGGCPGSVPLPAPDPIPPVAFAGAVPAPAEPQEPPANVTAPQDIPAARQDQVLPVQAPVDFPVPPPVPELGAPPVPPDVPFVAVLTPPINTNYNLPDIIAQRAAQNQAALNQGANPIVVGVADQITKVTAKGAAMINPIGSWLVRMDASILVSGDAALQGFAPLITIPVSVMCLLFLAQKGTRFASGDSNALPDLWFGCMKLVAVVSLSLNLGDYDYYVRDVIYTTLPNLLAASVANGVANGVTSVASAIDALWAQSWVYVANAWQAAGTFDFGTMIAAWFSAVTIGFELVAMALVYLLARLLLSVVLVFGPICIACSLHRQTAPIYERWLGKCIALMFLQVAGIIVLVMVFAANKYFLDQLNPYVTGVGNVAGWAAVDGSPMPRTSSSVQALTSMVMWVGMGAFALYSLPAIAYSIGTGVAVSFMPVVLALAAAGNAVAGAAAFGIPGFGTGSSESLSLSLARDELEGTSSYAALPPPPPPSISSSSPPAAIGF